MKNVIKINSFSTNQFAGIRTREPITFKDGMNVVLGNNEDGKSTMISAISYTLNKAVKLNLRTDKEFINRVFPTDGANTIDTAVCFQEGEKEYKIEKTWDRTGEETSAKLTMGDSRPLRGAQAEEALKKAVRFGEGVYDNLIFGRQNHEQEILDWCYRFFTSKSGEGGEETKKKITEAFSAAGGISPDKFLEMLNARLDGDSGKKTKGLTGNWDFDRDMPKKRTRGGRWEKGNGSILEAYYAYEDAREEQKAAIDTEEKIVGKTQNIARLQKEKSKLEDEKDELTRQQGVISDRDTLESMRRTADDNREKAERAMTLWPQAEQTLETLGKLKAAVEERDRRRSKESLEELLGQVSQLEEASGQIRKELALAEGYETDETEARTLSQAMDIIQGKLTAAKLRAAVSLEPGYKAEIVLGDGTKKEISGIETVEADGFIRLAIPGVASIQVSPQELDVDGLEREKAKKAQRLNVILTKYGFSTWKALEQRARELDQKKVELRGNETLVGRLLAGKTVEEWEAERNQIVINESMDIPDSLDKDIQKLLAEYRKSSLDEIKGTLEGTLNSYKTEYEALDKLPGICKEFDRQVKDCEEKLLKYADTPKLSAKEYEAKVRALRAKIDDMEEEIRDEGRKIGILSTQEVTDMAGLETKVREAEERWLHEKKKYECYMRIKKDFMDLRSEEGNPMGEFYDKFNEYLGIITNQRISLNLEGGGLCLKSGSQKVDTGALLSEGTKKTVLLAFRLAVLGYFFPAGGGFVVLDDDLLDMDPDRREQAAKLLNEFARSNQVIFTTCDPAIAQLLGGNLIHMQGRV